MSPLEKVRLLARILAWRVRWDRRDLDHVPRGVDRSRFATGGEAAARIPDRATVISCGMAGNARCSAFFWAVRDRFEAHGRPRGLTWISVGAQGGRGKAPGTVEELGLPGLLARYISGHVETAKSLLALAEAGRLELQVLPQGEMALLIEGQGRGLAELASNTALDTFLDPRHGRGSAVTPGGEPLVARDGTGLAYRLPPIDVALFAASWADPEGNVYLHDMATLTETREAVAAAKRNGGQAMAVVAGIIEPAAGLPRIAAERLDAVVVNPFNEQTVGVPQRGAWALFTPGGDGDDHAAVERLRFVNRLLRITPARGPVEQALGRLGASLFAEIVPPGAHINIGVGFPEEVCREVYESRLARDLVFTTETGVYGGLPAPGIYFGAAVNPLAMESSAWMFRHYREQLDTAVLGLLEVDSEGNVNVSRRGPRITDYVGPGGFPSIVESAQRVIFIGSFMAGARWRMDRRGLRLERAGKPKFVERVDEVTFSGPRALAQDKQVYYVTNLGVFQLTRGGLELIRKMPGVDVDRDLRANTRARVRIGAQVPEAASSVASGRDFELDWPGAARPD